MGNIYFLPIEREEVESLKYYKVLVLLRTLEKSENHGFDSVVLTFSGYDDIPDEIFEIADIRKWVEGLFSRVPHVLYFLNELTESRQNVLSCFCDVEFMYRGERKTIKEWEEELGDLSLVPQMPVAIKLNKDKRKLIADGLRKYCLKVKDVDGLNRIDDWLSSIFTDRS